MNDETTVETPVPAPTPEVPPVPPVAPPVEHPQAANIATAKQLLICGQKIEHVGAWLYATAAGAFTSVEHAIEHILGKVPKV
jgi:hypothetical protein